jgi:hypothetical protein
MAKMIGKTKSWAWWLGGLFCALVFGRSAAAQDQRDDGRGMQTMYGVRPIQQDQDIQIKYGVRPSPSIPEFDDETPAQPGPAERAKADKLVADYLAAPAPARLAPGQKALVDQLVKDLDAAGHDRREAASAGLARIGAAALPALRAAGQGSGPAARRARQIVLDIESAAREPIAAALRALPAAAPAAVAGKLAEEARWAEESGQIADEAEKAGDHAKAKAARADQDSAGQAALLLRGLQQSLGAGR